MNWQEQMPVWARGRCRISPPRFLAECCKRQLNQVSLVLLYFRLSAFSDLYWVSLPVFSCTVLFVSISQVIGCEDRLRNDLYCVGWGVKLYSNQTKSRADWQLSFHSTEPDDYPSFVAAYKLTTYRPDGSETIGPLVSVISGGHTEREGI